MRDMVVPLEAGSEKQVGRCEWARFRGSRSGADEMPGQKIWTNRFAADEGHLRQSLQSGITIRKVPCEG
jgi:hypothetical protein